MVLPAVVSMLGVAIRVQPHQNRANAATRERNARISGTVVEIDGVAIGSNRIAARKHNVLNISMTFVFRFGREYPGIPSNQAFFRLFQIEES
jgi:hypothetical protein